MQEILNATDVRKEWGEFVDKVTRLKPAVVKRSRDYFAAMSLEHLNMILSPYRFTLGYEQESDGSFSGSIKELDMVANAQGLEELKEQLAKDVIDYAHEYMEEFQLYYNAPNRRSHFPYVIRALIQPDVVAVMGLMDA